MESVNRRFGPEGQEEQIGLSEDLLGVSGDSWGFADEGVRMWSNFKMLKNCISKF